MQSIYIYIYINPASLMLNAGSILGNYIFYLKWKIRLVTNSPRSDGSLKWLSHMRRWVGPFLSVLYAFCEVGTCFVKDWSEIGDSEPYIAGDCLSKPGFLTPRTLFIERLNIEIYTAACALAPSGTGVIGWSHGLVIGGILVINGAACVYSIYK